MTYDEEFKSVTKLYNEDYKHGFGSGYPKTNIEPHFKEYEHKRSSLQINTVYHEQQ